MIGVIPHPTRALFEVSTGVSDISYRARQRNNVREDVGATHIQQLLDKSEDTVQFGGTVQSEAKDGPRLEIHGFDKADGTSVMDVVDPQCGDFRTEVGVRAEKQPDTGKMFCSFSQESDGAYFTIGKSMNGEGAAIAIPLGPVKTSENDIFFTPSPGLADEMEYLRDVGNWLVGATIERGANGVDIHLCDRKSGGHEGVDFHIAPDGLLTSQGNWCRGA